MISRCMLLLIFSLLIGCDDNVLVVQDGPAIDVNTLQLDFGEVNVGEPAELRLVVTNIGEQALIIEAITPAFSDSMFQSMTLAPLQIGRNQSEELTFSFFPVTAELFLGGIDLVSNAENLDTVRIELKGQGREWSICADCDNPPVPECATERYRLVYDEQGSCEGENQCRFAVGVQTCAEICLNGVCVGGLAGNDGGLLCASGDPDTDGDGACDGDDNCPTVGNPGQEDTDGDGNGDICDICDGFDDNLDDDEDEVPNGCDICTAGDDNTDTDNDDVPDACDKCEGHVDSLDSDADGVPDGCDTCANGSDALDTDNDGVANDCDVCEGHDDSEDADNDDVPDGCDICPLGDDTVDTDNDGIANACDLCGAGADELDDDNDGVPNACDVCEGYSDNLDTDEDTVPDGCDVCSEGSDFIDNDNDDIPDACDSCPGANNTYDDDADGVPNGCDICPQGPDHVDTDGDGVPNACDVCPALNSVDQSDNDADGVGDLCDNCVQIGNPTQTNSDGDQWGDACDRCPWLVHANDQTDSDLDGVGDLCDVCSGFDDTLDADSDEIPNGCDNCPNVHSFNQNDSDSDGVGDVCDACPGSDDTLDQDGDTIPDGCDICNLGPNNLDSDGDGVANACDICPGGNDAYDSDGDTVPNACDICEDGDDREDADFDSQPDSCDPCPTVANENTTDSDNDLIPDVCDACINLPNGEGTDVDNDGRDDKCVQATCFTSMSTWPAITYPFSQTPDRFERYAQCENETACPSGYICVDGRCLGDASTTSDAGEGLADESQWLVKDDATGLVWQGCMLGETGANCTSGERVFDSHTSLAASCASLNFSNWGGISSGWRMATIQELMSLVDYSHTTPYMDTSIFPQSEGLIFSLTSKANSATTYAYMLAMESDATHTPGWVKPAYKASSDHGTRCVVGSLTAQRCFSDKVFEGESLVDDEVILDYSTQLEWQKGTWGFHSEGAIQRWEYNFVGGNYYVNSRDIDMTCTNGNPCCATFAGTNDWRQPTIGELASLLYIGVTQTDAPNWPQIIFDDPSYEGLFWSKTWGPEDIGRRWGINFFTNLDLVRWKESAPGQNGAIKCVRDMDAE